LDGLPTNESEIRSVLQSTAIEKIFVYPLGSSASNIGQVNLQFLKKMGIQNKTIITYCKIPEIAVKESLQNNEPNTVSFFWSCAVFHRENKLFFENPTCLPFFCEEHMFLDEMQLCIRPELLNKYPKNIFLPTGWSIASHGAPAPLVRSLPCKIVDAYSNDDASKRCFNKEVELCITTESARRMYGLTKVHSFGSPKMVFFAGITEHGAKTLSDVFQKIRAC